MLSVLELGYSHQFQKLAGDTRAVALCCRPITTGIRSDLHGVIVKSPARAHCGLRDRDLCGKKISMDFFS
jgi:hypothetical protein